MSVQDEFHQWLVLDWAGSGVTWARIEEPAGRFLLVTPTERKWDDNLSAFVPLPNRFVIIALLSRAKPLRLETDKALGAGSGSLPIWCHYGGDISLRRLEDEWRRTRLLDERLGRLLTARLPARRRCAMPFSRHIDFPWHVGWKEIESTIRYYRPDQWSSLIVKLNAAWKTASAAVQGDDAKVALARWLGTRNACDRLLLLLPDQSATDFQLETLREEARALRIPRLRPVISGAHAEYSGHGHGLGAQFEVEPRLLAAFTTVLNQIMMVRRANVDSLRTALLGFQRTYDETIELAKVDRRM